MSLNIKDITIDEIRKAIDERRNDYLLELINEMYPADIAELLDDLNLEEAKYVYSLVDKEEAAAVLMELEDDVRERFVNSFSTTEIAHDLIDNLDSDDAADLINELPDNLRGDVLSKIVDRQQAQDIADLLHYPDDTAGGLMGERACESEYQLACSHLHSRNACAGC